MPIEQLPPSTIRKLGASQVIIDPSSVVKELIDNALDARADSIIVETSSNTLDMIQVRDNGHGIAPEDRSVLCKKFHTSKIRKYSDLKSIGALWLGFRGEALASISEMSDTTSIITRVEGEDAGTLLKFDSDCVNVCQQTVGHAVGTCVRVTRLYERLPVRKQTASKTSNACLKKIKKIVQAYTLARPSVRFSLKVLGSPSSSCNWMHAARHDANILDAASSVVGRDCASQCSLQTDSLGGYEIQALLPRISADAQAISNTSHFISIDSRPVSATRGKLREVAKLCKDSITKALDQNIKDPFFCINIKCPSGSYDVNVEPSKNDVIFEEPTDVFQLVKHLLTTHFHTPQDGLSADVETHEVNESEPEDLRNDRYTSTVPSMEPSVLPSPHHEHEQNPLFAVHGPNQSLSAPPPWTFATCQQPQRSHPSATEETRRNLSPLSDSDLNSIPLQVPQTLQRPSPSPLAQPLSPQPKPIHINPTPRPPRRSKLPAFKPLTLQNTIRPSFPPRHATSTALSHLQDQTSNADIRNYISPITIKPHRSSPTPFPDELYTQEDYPISTTRNKPRPRPRKTEPESLNPNIRIFANPPLPCLPPPSLTKRTTIINTGISISDLRYLSTQVEWSYMPETQYTLPNSSSKATPRFTQTEMEDWRTHLTFLLGSEDAGEIHINLEKVLQMHSV